ncbi:MAG: signal peptidase I [Cyanobacteriota bacterium]|jgi:signal peptidase I
MTQSASSPRPFWKSLWENVRLLAFALILALVIRFFIAEPRYIPSDSMLPTLEQGDRLVIEKVSYHFREPQAGDIVVFHPPEQLQTLGYSPDQAFIKRVIAQGGDTVSVEGGRVYRNGQPLAESYPAETPRYQLAALTVPEGYLFVLGDNRNNSNDSHVWGFLPEEEIIGRAVFRFFPLNRWGLV